MYAFLSGVATAMSPMGSDDVLEAKMVLAGAILSYSANIFLLRSMFSTTASTTRSAVFSASSAFVAVFSL